jgi:quercetin dioxygenase-like cupin family protein
MNALLKLRTKLEAEGYQVSMHLLAPGTVFGDHCLAESRIEAVFTGHLRLVIGGCTHELGPGDWLEVPAGVTIVSEVVGDEPVLGMDAAHDRSGA